MCGLLVRRLGTFAMTGALPALVFTLPCLELLFTMAITPCKTDAHYDPTALNPTENAISGLQKRLAGGVPYDARARQGVILTRLNTSREGCHCTDGSSLVLQPVSSVSTPKAPPGQPGNVNGSLAPPAAPGSRYCWHPCPHSPQSTLLHTGPPAPWRRVPVTAVGDAIVRLAQCNGAPQPRSSTANACS